MAEMQARRLCGFREFAKPAANTSSGTNSFHEQAGPCQEWVVPFGVFTPGAHFLSVLPKLSMALGIDESKVSFSLEEMFP